MATAASCSTGCSSLFCSARLTRTRTDRKPRTALSPLDGVVVRPAMLTDDPARGSVRAVTDLAGVNGGKVARADVAPCRRTDDRHLVAADTGHLVAKFGPTDHLFGPLKSAEIGCLGEPGRGTGRRRLESIGRHRASAQRRRRCVCHVAGSVGPSPGWSSEPRYGARSGYDVRTRCIRGCTESRRGVGPGRIGHETEHARFCVGRIAGSAQQFKATRSASTPA